MANDVPAEDRDQSGSSLSGSADKLDRPVRRLRRGVGWRLSVLWLLEWGITGAVLTYLPLFLSQHQIPSNLQGRLMAVTAVGLWLAPLIVGQVCDRWLASEKYLSIAHFVGGVTLVAIPTATRMYDPDSHENFVALMVLFGLYAVAYFPTMPLASALTFRHLNDPERDFGRIRIWGTVGWVLSGLSLSLWLGRSQAYEWISETFPQWTEGLAGLRSGLTWMGAPTSADCFYIAALLSFALSSFCVFLPPTPPAHTPRGQIAPIETLRMFRDRTFRILIAISFLLAMIVPLYTMLVPPLLNDMGIRSNWVPAVMTIGQVSEFPALLLLPYCLHRFGARITFSLGIAAWFVRYTLFAFGGPTWLILTGVGFHGVCHVFLIIVIQLYVDSQCRSDLRTSAQNLFTFITMGIAMPIGFLLGGMLADVFSTGTTTTDYRFVFGIPAVLLVLILVAYLRLLGDSDDWVRTPKEDSRQEPLASGPTSLAAR